VQLRLGVAALMFFIAKNKKEAAMFCGFLLSVKII
jgi:hypothetical protein